MRRWISNRGSFAAALAKMPRGLDASMQFIFKILRYFLLCSCIYFLSKSAGWRRVSASFSAWSRNLNWVFSNLGKARTPYTRAYFRPYAPSCLVSYTLGTDQVCELDSRVAANCGWDASLGQVADERGRPPAWGLPVPPRHWVLGEFTESHTLSYGPGGVRNTSRDGPCSLANLVVCTDYYGSPCTVSSRQIVALSWISRFYLSTEGYPLCSCS